MATDRAPDIYVPLLMTKGHGYPLWLPDPFSTLPPAYLRCGTQVGDLGYLTDDGGFAYLFNVCKDASDPINLNRVPPDFEPVTGIPGPGIQGRAEMHDKNSVIATSAVEKKSIGFAVSGGVPNPPVVFGAGCGFEFTSSSSRAAVLVLPDGGARYDSEHPLLLEEYATSNAHSWYKYLNGPRQGRRIRNGMLYLVTGYDKCHSWGNACYSHAIESSSASLKFMATDVIELTGTVHYSWEVQPGVHKRNHDRDMTPGATANQTIFLRGYSISIVEKSYRKFHFRGKVKLRGSEKPLQDSSIPYSAAPQSSTTVATVGTTSGTARGHGAGMKRRTARPLNFDGSEIEGSSYDKYSRSGVAKSLKDESETDTSVMDIPYGRTTMRAGTLVQQLPGQGKISNPSALINKHILDTHPDATIALTHDDFEWRGMENNVRNPLNVMELAKYAIGNNLVSINESETTPNAWVAKRQDTDIGIGTFTRQADIFLRDTLPKVALSAFTFPKVILPKITLPTVTLSAFTETGQAESSIEVPKQQSYSGRSPVISSHLADTPCATLGVQGVLGRLNATLGTSHTLHTARSSSKSTASPAPSSAASIRDQLSFLSILKDFIERNDDFGTAYALLRTVWNTHNPSNELRRRKMEDRERRRKALVGNRIVDPDLTPRRVWDLCSNRVVPSWITDSDKSPTPISHAWVDEKDRVDVRTPINGKEWPVPIPKDADLNLIRIEMLNLGAEYVWLDVLCLRQKDEGGLREDLRMEEWKLDVPTIGGMYNGKVVIYLSGLGRPLRLKDGDLDSNRNWFRRAWTLQEVGWERIIVGDTPDGPMHAQQIDGGNYETALLTRFHEELHSVKRDSSQIFAILADMQKRVSTNPVDKVAGLTFPLRPDTIPAYHENETLEDAWTALLNAMDPRMRSGFLFVYPGVGLGGKKWRPTWDQVMKQPLPKDVNFLFTRVQHDDGTGEDWFDGRCIEKGHVRVFDTGSEEGRDRRGELVVEATEGIARTFKIHVTHQFPIPEDMYTLLGDASFSYHWAIGRRLPDQKFEKVSVIVMDKLDNEERQKLKDLIPAAESRIVLI